MTRRKEEKEKEEREKGRERVGRRVEKERECHSWIWDHIWDK